MRGEDWYEAVKQAITRRITMLHLKLFEWYGLERVHAAIENQALSHEGTQLEEIGSSDVSCWVLNIKDQLAREGALDALVGKRQDLLTRAAMAEVASCNCRTKTPNPSYHTPTCRYRVLVELAAEVRRLQATPADTSSRQGQDAPLPSKV